MQSLKERSTDREIASFQGEATGFLRKMKSPSPEEIEDGLQGLCILANLRLSDGLEMVLKIQGDQVRERTRETLSGLAVDEATGKDIIVIDSPNMTRFKEVSTRISPGSRLDRGTLHAYDYQRADFSSVLGEVYIYPQEIVDVAIRRVPPPVSKVA